MVPVCTLIHSFTNETTDGTFLKNIVPELNQRGDREAGHFCGNDIASLFDGFFVLAEVLPERDLLLVLVEDPVCDFFGRLGRKVALRHVRMLHVYGLQDRLLVLVLLSCQFLGGGSNREIA